MTIQTAGAGYSQDLPNRSQLPLYLHCAINILHTTVCNKHHFCYYSAVPYKPFFMHHWSTPESILLGHQDMYYPCYKEINTCSIPTDTESLTVLQLQSLFHLYDRSFLYCIVLLNFASSNANYFNSAFENICKTEVTR